MPEKIGFVGVGRMGSNMARRLKDSGYTISAVYDARGKVAKEVGAELQAEPCKNLARVTELSDVIITVVSDDAAMDNIFAAKGASLSQRTRRVNFSSIARRFRRTIHIEVEKPCRRRQARRASKRAWPRALPRRAREPSI